MPIDSPKNITPHVRPLELMTAEFEEIFPVDGGGLGVGFCHDPSVYFLEPESQAHRDLKEALAARRNPSDKLWLQVGLITAKKGSQNATIVSASRTSKPPPFDASMVPYPPIR